MMGYVEELVVERKRLKSVVEGVVSPGALRASLSGEEVDHDSTFVVGGIEADPVVGGVVGRIGIVHAVDPVDADGDL